jgi:CBS domain-containing protein
MANTVSEVMTRNPVVLSPSSTIEEAAQMMRDRNIGDVIVADGGALECGIVTDRDVVIRVIAEGKDAKKTRLESVCSRDVTALKPSQPADEAVRLMREKAVRRLPVVDNGNVVGIVSLGDLAVQRDQHSVLGEISSAPPNH